MSILKHKIFFFSLAIIFSIIFALLSAIYTPLNLFYESSFKFFNSKPEKISEIILIKITDEDISSFGNYWPIKRTIYASLIDRLQRLKAKWIGIEIFFPETISSRKIYDEALIEIAGKYKNLTFVALPVNPKLMKNSAKADSIIYPFLKKFYNELSIGHTSYFYENGKYKIPNFIFSNNAVLKSLSQEIADKNGYENYNETTIINFLNYEFESYSLLQFYNIINDYNIEKSFFENKIFLIGVDSKFFSQKIEVGNQSISAFYLHTYALANLIKKNSYNDDFFLFSSFAFVLISAIILFLFFNNDFLFYLSLAVLLFLPFILSYLMKTIFYLDLNYAGLILPTLTSIIIKFLFWKQLHNGEANVFYEEQSRTNKIEAVKKNFKDEEKSFVNQIVLQNKQAESKKEAEQLSVDIEQIKSYIQNAKYFEGIWYSDETMEKKIELIKISSQTNKPVLIYGESGSGKELVARAIHNLSSRKDKNFVAVNCAALNETLLESELFGHIKGAFTGAYSDKIGRFELADGGTIFLDEIGETSELFQTKLLRVVQFGTFEKVGSSKEIKVDARVIAATNKNLEKLVAEKKFREDLFYRLKVLFIELPPLRKRRKDIPILAVKFAEKENLKISENALWLLFLADWKGNVRELEAAVNRAAIFAKSKNRDEILPIDFDLENLKENYDLGQAVVNSLRQKRFAKSSIMETAYELGDLSRNTVTEYFRGECFKAIVENDFDFEKAALVIAGSDDKEAIEKVRDKINIFIENLKKDLPKNIIANDESEIQKFIAAKYKNLPQKYRIFLVETAKKTLKALEI